MCSQKSRKTRVLSAGGKVWGEVIGVGEGMGVVAGVGEGMAWSSGLEKAWGWSSGLEKAWGWSLGSWTRVSTLQAPPLGPAHPTVS